MSEEIKTNEESANLMSSLVLCDAKIVSDCPTVVSAGETSGLQVWNDSQDAIGNLRSLCNEFGNILQRDGEVIKQINIDFQNQDKLIAASYAGAVQGG